MCNAENVIKQNDLLLKASKFNPFRRFYMGGPTASAQKNGLIFSISVATTIDFLVSLIGPISLYLLRVEHVLWTLQVKSVNSPFKIMIKEVISIL